MLSDHFYSFIHSLRSFLLLKLRSHVATVTGSVRNNLSAMSILCGTSMWVSNDHDVGRGDALVESMTFNRRVVGSTPSLAATYGPWASPLPAGAFALRHETPIQYPCCSRERL